MPRAENKLQPILAAAVETEMRSREHSPLLDPQTFTDRRKLFHLLPQHPDFKTVFLNVYGHQNPVEYARALQTTPDQLYRGAVHQFAVEISYTSLVERKSQGRLVGLRPPVIEELQYELAMHQLAEDPTSEAAIRVLDSEKYYDPDIIFVDRNAWRIPRVTEATAGLNERYAGWKNTKLTRTRKNFPEAYQPTQLEFAVPYLTTTRGKGKLTVCETPYTYDQLEDFLAQTAEHFAPSRRDTLVRTHPKLAAVLQQRADRPHRSSSRGPQRAQRISFANR